MIFGPTSPSASRRTTARRLIFAACLMIAPGFLSLSGCGRRTYPARDPVAFVHQDGAVEIAGIFNQCPVARLEASPATGSLDQPFAVDGSGSDPEGVRLTFSLQSDSGTFADRGAASTTFTCSQAGPVTITLAVSDGFCQTMTSVSIFCLGVHPSDAGAEAGIDARIDVGAHADADRGDAAGTGGRSGGGGATGSGGAGPVTNSCPQEPISGTTSCAGCTQDNCSLASNPDGTDGCCGIANAADQLLCEAAVACFVSARCTVGGDAGRCFCGANQSTCYSAPGAATGPCVLPVIAAAKTSDPATIRSLFTSPASPLGRAVNLMGCRGSFCGTECDVP